MWIRSMRRARELYAYKRVALFTSVESTLETLGALDRLVIAHAIKRGKKKRGGVISGLGFLGFSNLFGTHPSRKEISLALKDSLFFFVPRLSVAIGAIILSLLIVSLVSSFFRLIPRVIYQRSFFIGSFTTAGYGLTIIFLQGLLMGLFLMVSLHGIQYYKIRYIPKEFRGQLIKVSFVAILLSCLIFPLVDIIFPLFLGYLDIFDINQAKVNIFGFGLAGLIFIPTTIIIYLVMQRWVSRFFLNISVTNSFRLIWRLYLGYAPSGLIFLIVLFFFILLYMGIVSPELYMSDLKSLFGVPLILATILVVCIELLIHNSAVSCPFCKTQIRKYLKEEDGCKNCGYPFVKWLELADSTDGNQPGNLVEHGVKLDFRSQRHTRIQINLLGSCTIICCILFFLFPFYPSIVNRIDVHIVSYLINRGNLEEAAGKIHHLWERGVQNKSISAAFKKDPNLENIFWSQYSRDWENVRSLEIVYRASVEGNDIQMAWVLSNNKIFLRGVYSDATSYADQDSFVIWDIKRNSPIAEFSNLDSFYFTDNGLMTIDGGSITLWDFQESNKPQLYGFLCPEMDASGMKNIQLGSLFPSHIYASINNRVKVIICDTETGKTIQSWSLPEDYIYGAVGYEFSDDGSTFVYTKNGQIEVFNTAGGELLFRIPSLTQPYKVPGLDLTKDFLVTRIDNTLKIWKVRDQIEYWSKDYPGNILDFNNKGDSIRIEYMVENSRYYQVYRIVPEVELVAEGKLEETNCEVTITGELCGYLDDIDDNRTRVVVFNVNSRTSITSLILPYNYNYFTAGTIKSSLLFDGQNLLVINNDNFLVLRPKAE